MVALHVFLEAVGLAVACELLTIAIILTFRHRYYDGYIYPWQISALFFLVGAGMLLIVSKITIVGVLRSVEVTFIGYGLIGVMGLIALRYYWLTYPKTHESAPCLILKRKDNYQPPTDESADDTR